MASNVFISFRYSDGAKYKEQLSRLFSNTDIVIDYSENKDRRNMSEQTIRDYLYEKLRRSSVVIVLITPLAVNYSKDIFGRYDDWLYDEARYSLEDRVNNRTKGMIGVYTDDAKKMIMTENLHTCDRCNQTTKMNTIMHFDNLVRANMMNVLERHKKNSCDGVFDSDYDSFVSLVSFDEFVDDFRKYIDIAVEKRNLIDRYNIKKKF